MSPDRWRFDCELKRRIRDNLETFERRSWRGNGLKPAAVAVTILPDAEERPCFILTRRARRLRRHSGQWALPGGRLDPGETVESAALRELHEELGIEVAHERVLGLLDDYPTRSGYVITPVVVWGTRGLELKPNSAEVASAHLVPLLELEAPSVPQFRSIPESTREVISIPLLGTSIHAPTAAIVYQLREVAVWGRRTRVDHFEQPVFAWS